MLVAASQLRGVLDVSFIVAHINHGLRGRESDGDARYVAKLARYLKFPVSIRVCRISRSTAGNLEEKARDQRYSALAAIAKRHRSRLVLTAHTQDDQAETIFMNLLRGTGSDGLAGIPVLRPLTGVVQLGRPFINLGRQELHRWLRRFDCQPREDRSNRDVALMRNWLRLRLFPMLDRRSPGFKARLGTLAALFQDEKEFWMEYLEAVERRVLRSYRGGRLLDLGGLLSYSAAVQRRFLRRIIGENLLTFDAVERLRSWMMSPPTAGRTFQLRHGWTVTRLSKSQGAPSAKLFMIKRMRITNEKI